MVPPAPTALDTRRSPSGPYRAPLPSAALTGTGAGSAGAVDYHTWYLYPGSAYVMYGLF